MKEIHALFNNVPNLKATIAKSIAENAELKKEIEEYAKEKAAMTKNELLKEIKEKNGMRYICTVLPAAPGTVKDIVFMLRQEQPENLLVVVGSIHNDKPQLTISVSTDLVERGINAGKIVGQAAREMQGGGGGQAHFAQAGGKNPEGIKAAIDKVFEIIEG
jgi:alanyl-tRNA synthetase